METPTAQDTRTKRGRVPIYPLVLALLLTGCQFTQSGFARTLDQAGSAFAAASATISGLHEGAITTPYARASFVNYQSELDGLDQQLPAQAGPPQENTVRRLLSLYKTAIHSIDHPCLENTCDWREQVKLLDQTSQAFLEASEQ